MIVGALEIQMMADLARLKKDMDEAKSMVGSAMGDIQNAVSAATSALAKLGMVASVAGLVAIVEKTIEGAAAMYKLSASTGVAVESLSALRGVAKLSGTDMGDVGTGLQKLSKNMVEAQTGTGKAAEAFKALGVNVTDNNGRLKTADQVMLETAKSMSGFEQGAGLTAAAMAIFGKAGANLIPMLLELADKGSLNGKMTAEQAKQAYEYEKAMIKQKAALEGVFRGLALDLIPILVKLTGLFDPAMKIAAGYLAVMYGLPAVMAAGAAAINILAATMIEGTVAATGFTYALGASVGATSAAITSFGLLRSAGLLALAAFAGWEIGKWLRENFVEARLAGVAFIDGLMTGWEHLEYAGKMMWLALQDIAHGAFAFIGAGLATMVENVGKGMRALGMEAAGKAAIDLAENIRKATTSTFDFNAESAKAKAQLDKNVAAIHSITNEMADEAIAYGKTAEAVKVKKKVLEETEPVIDANAEASRKATEAGVKWVAALDAKLAVSQQEYELGRKLSESEKAQADMMAKLTDGTISLTAGQREHAKAVIAANEAYDKGLAAKIEGAKLTEALTKETEKLLDAESNLTAGQKLLVKMHTELASGKMKLTDAQIAANIATVAANDLMAANAAWAKQSAAENDKAAEAIYKERDALVDQVAKQREANAAIGATALELLNLERARLDDAAAAKDQRAAMLEVINAESDEAKALRESAAALRERSGLLKEGFDKKAALDSAEAWKKTSEAIGKDLTDALLAGPQALKDYLNRTVFDMVVRAPLQGLITGGVNAIGGALGVQGAGGSSWLSTTASGASLASNGSSMFGALGSLGQGSSALWGSALGSSGVAEAAALGADATMGSLVAMDTAMAGTVAGSTAAGGIGAGVSTALGSIPVYGWIALAVLAAASYFSKAVTPHTGGYAMANADGTVNDITAAQGGIQNKEMQSAVTTFARGAASMINDTAKLFGQASNVSVRSVFESDKTDPSWGLFHLLAGGQRIGGFDALGTLDKDPTKGFEQYTTQASASIRDALVAMDLPGWVDDILTKLGGTPTMQSLAAAIDNIHRVQRALDAMGEALSPLGGIFGKIASLSADAKIELAGMVGGIDQLVAKTGNFVKLYYSKDEQGAIGAAGILRAATAAGLDSNAISALSGLTDRAGFRALLESVDPTTSIGRVQTALGLNVAQTFSDIADLLGGTGGKTLGDLASAAPQVALFAASNDAAASTAAGIATLDTTTKSVGDQIAEAVAQSTSALSAKLDDVQAKLADALDANARYVGNAVESAGS